MATTKAEIWCSATVYGPRVHHWSCNRRGVVKRGEQWFCKQHDPKSEQARRKARNDKHAAHDQEQEAILSECRNAADELGCGQPYWHTALRGGFNASGYRRQLVITLAEARDLASMIRKLHVG